MPTRYPSLPPKHAQNLARDFDECVILLSMLGPSLTSQSQRSNIDSNSRESEMKWHLFLDQLSWLCDYKTGGKTVASIAAESKPSVTVFYLASNSDSSSKAKSYLEWVLGEMQTFVANPIANLEETQRRLFQRSVSFSHERVVAYSETLKALIQSSRSLRKDGLADQELSDYLETLMSACDNNEELCTSAFKFRKGPVSRLLSDKIVASKQCPLWPALRHYIGRLGSWWKAITIVTNTAHDLPDIFRNFRIKSVGQPAAWASNPVSTGLDEAFSRLLPSIDLGPLDRVRNSLTDRWGEETNLEFESRHARRTARPCVHAELSIFEHFYRNKLSFTGGDPYIGCSKPSCYCCDLYMQLHPHKISRRPCHGNVWVKWCLPVQANFAPMASGLDATNLVKKMIEKMRDDIFSGNFPIPTSRMPESTTGITKTRSS